MRSWMFPWEVSAKSCMVELGLGFYLRETHPWRQDNLLGDTALKAIGFGRALSTPSCLHILFEPLNRVFVPFSPLRHTLALRKLEPKLPKTPQPQH